MKHMFKVALATAASTLRGWQGMVTEPAAVQPDKPLKLYEFEGCPYCRLVRETLTELSLDADVYPCPKGGQRFRPEVVAQGGKAHLLGGAVMQVSPDPSQGLIVHRRKPRCRALHTQPQGDIAG